MSEVTNPFSSSTIYDLRRLRADAPERGDDFAHHGEFATAYVYGTYAPTDTQPGLLYVEAKVPRQHPDNRTPRPQIPDSRNRFKTPEQIRYENARSFASLMRGTVGHALESEGFGSLEFEGEDGSHAFAIVYPSTDALQQTMAAKDPNAFELQLTDAHTAHDPRVVSQALIERRLVAADARQMIRTLSMQTLLGSGVHESFRGAAMQEAKVGCFNTAARVSDITTMSLGPHLVKAVEVAPIGVQELDAEFSTLLDIPVRDVALATKTAEYIESLAA